MAYDQANPELVAEAAKQLETKVKFDAKVINQKYLDPPNTTDFAVMYVPIEGLYSEIVRRPGLCSKLQADYRVVVAGPTTFGALLNALQVGFRTLAISKRSNEVWMVLAGVKTEFGKFSELLEKTKKKLEETTNVIDDASRRSRAIERKLGKVQKLPSKEPTGLLESLDALDTEKEKPS